MTGPFLDDHADYIIREYRAGRSSNKIASEFGVTQRVISRILKRAGVTLRGRRDRSVTDDMVAELYTSGLSENAVSKRLGIARTAVRRRLIESGVHIRSQSESETLKWSTMTDEQRAAQTEAAHKATKGRKATFDELCKRAQTCEALGKHGSTYERDVHAMLAARGIDTVPQRAIGPYNCDLAAGSVAVEVWGGHWHWFGYHRRVAEKRFRYIMDHGWCILVLCINKSYPLTAAVADYLAAEIKRLHRHPPDVCQYRMIWGPGQFTTGGRADSDEFTIEPPFARRTNPATGQYETVTR